MITDILTYIESYDNIRAICGLSSDELSDATLALALYKNHLGLALENTTGIYDEEIGTETLVELFARLADTTDMYAAIQQYSIYVVADKVMDSVGLRALKAIGDGKAAETRFSAESTYQDVRQAIKDALMSAMNEIGDLFGEAASEESYLTVVTPSVDVVLGE